MYIEGLDKLDNKILRILFDNARLTYSEIGKLVGISRVAVRNRIDALEQKGIIQGYKTVINPDKLPGGRRFFLDIITEASRFNEVLDAVASRSIVHKVYALTGESRLKAEGYTSSNALYEALVKDLKRDLNGIKSFTIQDALYTVKDIVGGVDYVKPDNENT